MKVTIRFSIKFKRQICVQHAWQLCLHSEIFWQNHFKISTTIEPKETKTLALWQPKENIDATSIIPDIKNHLNTLASKIEDLQPLIKRNVTVASPANERIVYDLQTALDIIVAHAWRHYEQAKMK